VDYVWAFVVGGFFCVLAQLVLDLAKLTPAHTLVLFVSLGAVASGLGLYKPLLDLAGAGAAVPLPGFGHVMTQGVVEALEKDGLRAIFNGGVSAAATGLGAAVIFGYVMSVLFNPRG